MPRLTLRGLLAACLAGTLVSVVPVTAAPTASTQRSHTWVAVGLGPAGKGLRMFNTEAPEQARRIGRITGLEGDTRLLGIDVRVQDHKLYGVGDQGGVYTLNPATAGATHVSQLTVPLVGDHFGVDFNPAADRLRVVSDTGQNLRHDLGAGMTTVDVPLTYPPDVAVANGISAAAYTNNDLAATTGTTLFDIDAMLDQVAVQAPANNGTLSATGKLGTTACPETGLDVASRVHRGATTGNTAFAVIQPACQGRFHLYRVDLLTGHATDLGVFARFRQVADLAIIRPAG